MRTTVATMALLREAIVITTEDGYVFRTQPIRQGLAMPLVHVAPCLGRHADALSAPLSVVAQPAATLDN